MVNLSAKTKTMPGEMPQDPTIFFDNCPLLRNYFPIQVPELSDTRSEKCIFVRQTDTDSYNGLTSGHDKHAYPKTKASITLRLCEIRDSDLSRRQFTGKIFGNQEFYLVNRERAKQYHQFRYSSLSRHISTSNNTDLLQFTAGLVPALHNSSPLTLRNI